ncbi:transglycosylase domain-containing protein [bacterium]|nr:transglycosylase domain-containing protein [bacterium]
MFSENREFVPLSNINQHMIDAIIAVEDQKFWEHEGLDPM